MASVTIDTVSKVYAGAAKAVDDIHIEIADGEFIVLVGPSGCGKSTLLRMVAGLETVTSGRILIGGRVVNGVDPADRDIAMVFQNYALYPHMTVRQNLAYGLKNRKVPRPEIERRVGEAARILEIGPYLDRKPRALSGGQRQRVAMGRAIVREPKVFLFDEPLSNLDAKLRVQMRGEIKQLQRRIGTTSIYVTHDQLEAMTLADRLVVLNEGRVEQIGTPLEVYRRPASTFVASFIGSPAMNLIAVPVDAGGAIVDGTRIGLPSTVNGAKSVMLGIRAEDLHTATPANGPITVEVSYVEELGANRLVHGRVAGQMMAVTIPSASPVADRMSFSVAPDALHVFDAQNGRRIG